MRIVVLLCVGALLAGCSEKTSFSEAQNLSRAAPTASSDGFDLSRVTGYRVSVCPPSGQAVTGGTVVAYVYNDAAAAWGRNKRKDVTLQGAGTDECEVLSDERVLYRGPFRYLPVASGVTLSGAGTQVTMRVDTWID